MVSHAERKMVSMRDSARSWWLVFAAIVVGMAGFACAIDDAELLRQAKRQEEKLQRMPPAGELANKSGEHCGCAAKQCAMPCSTCCGVAGVCTMQEPTRRVADLANLERGSSTTTDFATTGIAMPPVTPCKRCGAGQSLVLVHDQRQQVYWSGCWECLEKVLRASNGR
jgi:hypothetical protein